jgi:TonB-linked SusC/RagA family outer membrane protein
MKLKLIQILTFAFLAVFQVSFAQQSVSGVVTDADGISLPGVTIVVEGTNRGTTSDFNGNYKINASQDDILVFSYVGYNDQSVSVDGAIQNISMQANVLDEVVVVAYGTQSKASLTGSVSVIDAEQIENSTYSNPVKSLEGLVSGLRIVQSNAVPGSSPTIRIRGFGSINASSAPLIVVDGVPYNESLNTINPQDIESTSVLKDASSTSLYGNKASNGVLLINTKKGQKNKKSTISLDSRIGVTQRGAKDYNVTSNPKHFYETYHSIYANSEYNDQNTNGDGMTEAEAYQYATDNLISNVGYNVYDVTNAALVDPSTGLLNPAANLLVEDYWEDALFRDNADFKSTNLNISGGANNIDYYFSLGTEENNGYTLRSNFNRHSTRLKINADEIAKNISLSADFSYANTKSQAVPSTFSGGAPASFYSNSFSFVRRVAPIYPVYKYDQNWNPILNSKNASGYEFDMGAEQTFADGSTRGSRKYAVNEHPLAVIENTIQTNEFDIFNGSIRGKIDLPYGFNFEYVSNYLSRASKSTDFSQTGSTVFATSNNGTLVNGRNNFSAFTNQQLLTWKNETDGNSFDFLLGHETYVEKFTTLSMYKTNLIGDVSPIINNASVYKSASNYNTKYATEGYFSRFIYGKDDTYFLTLTGRYDASSVFHPDERWGVFWSAGGSWIMSNEEFMKNLSAIDYAKFSVNYGTSGNDRIFYASGGRNYVAYENQYEITENNGALAQSLFSLGSKEISWEKSSTLNVSYDLSINNKVNLSLAYYIKETKDLLFNNPIPLSTGQPSKPENIGTMENSGLELEAGWMPYDKDDLSISLNANLSTLKNELTELPKDSIQVGNFRRVVGKSIYDYYMVRSAGVNPDNGNAQYFTTDSTGKEVITEDHADATTDGRAFLGKTAIPDFFGGFGTNIQYGNFSLNLQFSYQIGGYGLDYEYFGLLGIDSEVTNVPDYNKTWTLNNKTADLPRVDPLASDQYAISDLYLTSLTYLGLNNINIGYTFKNEELKKYNINSVRLYSTINNALLLYSARQGYDPRLSLIGNSAGEYGINRTIAFGLKINLN